MSQQSCDIESLEWFHPNLTRHTAESILLQNGKDGTYLLRPSSKGGGEYALSVKFEQSVKHFNIVWTGTNITFGHGTFRSIGDFVEHFKNKPLIGTESSQLVLLKVKYFFLLGYLVFLIVFLILCPLEVLLDGVFLLRFIPT